MSCVCACILLVCACTWWCSGRCLSVDSTQVALDDSRYKFKSSTCLLLSSTQRECERAPALDHKSDVKLCDLTAASDTNADLSRGRRSGRCHPGARLACDGDVTVLQATETTADETLLADDLDIASSEREDVGVEAGRDAGPR